MTDPYTPSLKEMREHYIYSAGSGEVEWARNAEQWDRFIAQVRAETLREAATWVAELAVHDGLMVRETEEGYQFDESIPTALNFRADRIEREGS